MEAARRCLGSNALFLMILLASVAGHVSLIWLRLADALEPELPPLESGRNSIAIHMIAEPAPATPAESIEPLPLDDPVPVSTSAIRLPEMPLARLSSPQEVIWSEPVIDGWEPVAAAATPPLERRVDAAAAPTVPPVEQPVPQLLDRRPSQQTVNLADARVDVPETLISDQASGSEVPPSFVSRSLPAYPEHLLLQRIEGVVQLLVTIDRTGRVASAKVHASSGYAAMDESALHSIRTWTFAPARRGNQPVEKTVLVPIRFTIRTERN